MQLLMGLEYYPWLNSKNGFPPLQPANDSSIPGGISCFWDPTPGCSQEVEDQELVDGIEAALKAMNISIGDLNCTQVSQCPKLYSALSNLTHDIQLLLHPPYELYEEYLLEQDLKHMSAADCACLCGYPGRPDGSNPTPACEQEWYGTVPYCNDTEPLNPFLEGGSSLTEYRDAVAACSIFMNDGYELPYGPVPLLSRGPAESLIWLAALGFITRALAYASLLCLDRRKR